MQEKKNKITQVEDMPVYQLFYELAIDVEKESRAFERDFRWLRIQALRSSESVCANMTEGFYSQYSTEYLQALYRCRREARETMGHLKYARDINQMLKEKAGDLLARYSDGNRQMSGLIVSIETKIATRGKGKPGFVKEETELYEIEHQPLTMGKGV